MDHSYTNLDDLKRKAIKRAVCYMTDRYGFGDMRGLAIPIRWSVNGCRSRYYCHSCRGFQGPHMQISLRDEWKTYVRKRVGLKTPWNGIRLPKLMRVTMSCIHELTHSLQHRARRPFSEVETTRNEINYVQITEPCYLKQLIPVHRWDTDEKIEMYLDRCKKGPTGKGQASNQLK
jgi:hypothetical protein